MKTIPTFPWNYRTLLYFAPILIIVGILGFILPASMAMTSGAAPYNIFHLFFGVLGLGLVWRKNHAAIRAFNLGFGLIDLYQALASGLHLFPEKYFNWTTTDDVLHVVIGSALVLVACCKK